MYWTENYSTGYRLTQQQKEYQELDSRALDAAQHLGLAFFANNPKTGEVIFSKDCLIAPANRVVVMTLQRVPVSAWKGPTRRGQRWVHLLQQLPLVAEDGQLRVNYEEALRLSPKAVKQIDFSSFPRQARLLLTVEQFDTRHKLIPDPDTLKSPIAGTLQVQESPAYWDITVGGAEVYRFRLKYQSAVELLVSPGDSVQKGDSIAKLTQKCEYGRVKLRDGKPIQVQPRRTCLAADMHPNLFRGANMLASMIVDQAGHPSPSPEEWAPQFLVEFSHKQFKKLQDDPSWVESPELISDICQGLSVDGGFYLKSPSQKPLRFIEERVTSKRCKEFVFLTSDGAQTSMEVWDTVQILESVKQGQKIRQGDPVADWLPREHYFPSNISAIKEALGPVWPLAVDSFLIHKASMPGTTGHPGHGVLVPAKYVRTVAHLSGNQWVDFRPAQDYFDNDVCKDFIVTPPIFCEDWSQASFQVGGIQYDLAPQESYVFTVEKQVHKAALQGA